MDRVPRTQGKRQNQAIQRQNLTIGQLSQLTGINTKAIRYYEGAGLLPCPPRGANHYRRYSMADVNRLLLLRRIRLLGVPLSAARTLLIGASDARCIDIQQELLALVDERLKVLDQEIANLQQFRVALANYQRALAACQPGENEPFSTCPDMECIDFTTASCS
jgi:DNA-binding transcriptional MerR regulator